jgi:hypothetical protein
MKSWHPSQQVFFPFSKGRESSSKWLSAICVIVTINSVSLFAQTKSFEFLNVPGNATLSALGGTNVSSTHHNLNFFQSNPALAVDTTDGWGSASYLFYFAGIGMANFSYQPKFDKIGALTFGVQHLGYGQIQGYDLIGTPTGKFGSGETALFIGKSHRINAFRLGANVKGVFSNVAGYRASAIMLDLGGVFSHPHQDLNIGLVIKNIGFLLSEYSETSTTRLPIDIQAGISFKPEHMPVRFSFAAHHLTSFDGSYFNPNEINDKLTTLDKVVRHFSVGGELLVHKNINLLIGYNFLKHQELKLGNAAGGSGLSVGMLAKVKSMELSVSRTGYVTGGSYQFSISANIKKMITSI